MNRRYAWERKNGLVPQNGDQYEVVSVGGLAIGVSAPRERRKQALDRREFRTTVPRRAPVR